MSTSLPFIAYFPLKQHVNVYVRLSVKCIIYRNQIAQYMILKLNNDHDLLGYFLKHSKIMHCYWMFLNEVKFPFFHEQDRFSIREGNN